MTTAQKDGAHVRVNPAPAAQANLPAVHKPSLLKKFADRYSVDPAKLMTTLKATAFRQRGNTVVSDEQMMALLIVADQYKLNPFTKEIFAFDDKGAIVPVVSVDGWARIINEHPALNGIEFRYSEDLVTSHEHKTCPAWCEVLIYRKDRDRPIVVREYLDEVYQPPRGEKKYPGPWQSHTKRFLRHKTLIQGSRIAFGFAGIYDEDEAARIVERDMGTADVIQAAPAAQAARPAATPERASRMASFLDGDAEDVPQQETGDDQPAAGA